MRIAIVASNSLEKNQMGISHILDNLTENLKKAPVILTRKQDQEIQEWAFSKKLVYLVWQPKESLKSMVSEADALIIFLAGKKDDSLDELIELAKMKNLKIKIVKEM